MKRIHLKKIINSTSALIIVAFFFLNPFVLKAQTEEYLGNQREIIGSSDSRMVITIQETDDNVILEVSAIGVMISDALQFTLVYQPDNLVLTDNTFAYNVPNPALDPGDFGSTVISIDPEFLSSYPTFTTQVMNHQNITAGSAMGMTSLNTAVGTLNPNESAVLKLNAGTMVPIYRIYFRKKVSGYELQVSDLGFFYNSGIPRTFSSWSYRGVSVNFAQGVPTDKQYVNQDLFLYRSASSITTHPVSAIAATSVTLNGNAHRGDFAPTKNMIVSGKTTATETGELDFDTIRQYGFIYSVSDIVITSNEFTDSLTIDGTKYEFPTSTEITAGTFTRGGYTFYIVMKNNEDATQSRNYSENITGLSENATYYAWAVMKYAFHTSDIYASVGERVTFDTESDCVPPEMPIAQLSQTFCEGATVADLIAFVEDGFDLVWYDNASVMLDPTDLLVDGITYYGKASDNGCESEAVEVEVALINGLNAPKVTTPQVFCPGSLVSDIWVEANGVIWYDALTGGNALNSDELLSDGFYYVALKVKDCESSIRSEVKIIIEETILDAPKIASPQNFCDFATLADIATDGSNIIWYSSNGALLPSNTALNNATIYYAAYQAGTCESSERTPVMVYTGMNGFIDPPVISSPQRFCEGATIQNIEVPNNQITWYITAEGNTEIPANTILSHDMIYYAAQRAGECESTERTPVRILFENQQGPEAPSPQMFCGTDFTLADLEITGSGIVWYDAMTGGNMLPSSTALTTTPTMYYAAQSAMNCESSRVGISAYVNAQPETPVISGDILLCSNENSIDLTIVVEEELNITYIYYSDEGNTVIEDPKNVPVPPMDDIIYYVKAINASSGCESESLGEINVVISTPPVVSVVPAGAYTNVKGIVILTITDDNTNQQAGAKTVTILDENIASIQLVNGELKVTGKTKGNTEVIYTSVNEDGCSTELIIPVQIEGLPTGILLGKDIEKCGKDTAIVQIAYVMGGVAPWTITVSDDRETFSKDVVVNSISDFPVNVVVDVPENKSNILEYTTYVISNIKDDMGGSKETHYGAVRIGVYPTHEISPVHDMEYCSGMTVSPYTFTGSSTGASYKWFKVDGDDIPGIPEEGYNIIPGFVASTTTQKITANYKVAAIYEYTNVSCNISDTLEFSITINPIPVMNNKHLEDMVYCNGKTVDEIDVKALVASTGNIADTEYEWRFVSGSYIGIPTTSGTNVIPEFVAVNEGNSPIINVYSVVAKNGDCESKEQQLIRIVINPGPSLTSLKDAGEICSGNTFEYIATSALAGTTFSWTRVADPDINGGETSTGNGQVISEVLINSSNAPVKVVYEFSLKYNDCSSSDQQVEVMVNPGPEINIAYRQAICLGETTVNLPYTVSNEMDMTYNIIFSFEALAAGFQNQTAFINLPENSIPIAVPENLNSGTYSGTINVRSGNCLISHQFEIETSEIIRITQQPVSPGSLCDENSRIELSVRTNSDNVKYQWYHDGTAVTGATAQDYSAEYNPDMDGEYYVIVSNSCMEIRSNSVTVSQSLATIDIKWDNVLFVSDIDHIFSDFQWYKDGRPVQTDGQSQYYGEENGLNGTYFVRCYYPDGTYVESCPKTFVSTKSTLVTLYPNPAESGSTVTLEIQTDEFNIEGAILEVFDAAGKIVSRSMIYGPTTEITAPMAPGTYSARVITESKHVIVERFIVGK